METIEEAKQFLRKNWEQGVKCPCCAQFVKQYKRKLTSGMAIGLINLYHESGKNSSVYVHITKLGHLNGGEFAQLKRWNLIDEAENDEPDTKRMSGKWCITNRGINFILGSLRVASHVFTYNGKTLGFEKTTIDINEALGKKFNYRELMGEFEDIGYQNRLARQIGLRI